MIQSLKPCYQSRANKKKSWVLDDHGETRNRMQIQATELRQIKQVNSRKTIEEVVKPHSSNGGREPLSLTHPELSKQWCSAKNCGFGPNNFVSGSGVKVWWQCPIKASHIWQASICSRAKGRGCPRCSRKKPALPEERSLAAAFPEIAADWHPRKNGTLKPTEVGAYSAKSVWWKCAKCQREWRTFIANRTRLKRGCYKCVYNMIGLFDDKYAEFLPFFDVKLNPNIDPNQISRARKVVWRCPADADHVWSDRVRKPGNRDRFCPFCAGSKLTPKALAKVEMLYSLGVSQTEILKVLKVRKNALKVTLKYLKEKQVLKRTLPENA